MEAGEVVPPPQRQRHTDVYLKSQLRKPSDSQKLAKKVKKKYSSKVKFSAKCRVKVISPLPGWTARKLRMPEYDKENEKSVSFPKTNLTNNLLITPESLKKLEQNKREEFNKRLEFNVTMVFGDEAHPDEEAKKDKVVKPDRRLTATHLNFSGVRDDSPDPPAAGDPSLQNPASVRRKASKSDLNLEDSQSSATNGDSTLPYSTTAAVHSYKASRAAHWLANHHIDLSHDSSLEREDLLIRAANESDPSTSEKIDNDHVFKEPEGRSTRRRIKSSANKMKPNLPPHSK